MKKIYYLIVFSCLLFTSVTAQDIKVSGRVTNSIDNSPLLGVSISVNSSSGQKNVAITDEKGMYEMFIPPNTLELIFSYTGMETETRKLNGQSIINVRMSPKNEQLDQVVITALGIKRSTKALSYSRQSMDVSTLTDAPSTNIVSSLSGRIAGVQITPPSSNTGSARIIIRGNNSITGNNQPLFVIDGIPVDNESGDANISVTTSSSNLDYGNVAGNINPEDIESIEILKGPNAAALYGSRAANGVVLITTKKSGGIKFKASFNSNATFQFITEFPEYQNIYGAGNSFKLEGSGSTDNPERIPNLGVFYRSWGAPMMGQPVISINGQPKLYLPQPNNVQDFYQPAIMLTNSIAMEGGNKENNYRFSYTNFSGGSVVAGINKNTRHNVNIRVFNTFTKWLDMDSKVTFIKNSVTNRQSMNGSDRNPVYQYAYMVRDDQLSEFKTYKNEYGNEINTHRDFLNPYWAIYENPNQDIKNQLLGALNINAKFNSWLKMTVKVGTEMYWLNGFTFNNKGSQIKPNGLMSTINNSLQSTNVDAILFANNKIGKVLVNSFLGAGRFQTSNSKNRQSINSLIQPGLINLSNSSEFPSVSQFSSQKIINSVYGSVSLSYNNYLFVDVTGRNDWSSTLPTSNNSYFYPSVGASFVFTDLIKNIPKNVLSFGKLRASYAIVGNDASPYQLIPTYSFDGIYNNQAYASLSSTFFNPDLKPEKTASQEFGGNFRFLKNRLSFDVTYYKSSTTNQIVSAQLTPTSGYQRRFFNAGEIQNWGTELSLGGTPIKNKKFTWDVQMNYAKNNSLVKSLIDGVDKFELNHTSTLFVYAEVGQPYGIVRGLGWKRDSIGRRLVGINGKPILEENAILGNALPDWTGGISNSFRYKNFNLSFLLDIRKGGSFVSGTFRRAYTSGALAVTLEGREDYYLHSYIYGESTANLQGGFIHKDAVFVDGSPNNIYLTPQSTGLIDPYETTVFDASYVKIREAVLSYSIPAKFLKNSIFTNAKAAVSGRNLWTLYKNCPKGIDPESSVTSGNGQGIEYGSLPPSSTIGFDIKLTF